MQGGTAGDTHARHSFSHAYMYLLVYTAVHCLLHVEVWTGSSLPLPVYVKEDAEAPPEPAAGSGP